MVARAVFVKSPSFHALERKNSRATDWAVSAAYSHVDQWIASRHRASNGSLDGKSDGPDVIRCLEFHGNDFRHVENPSAAARRGAERYQAALDDLKRQTAAKGGRKSPG